MTAQVSAFKWVPDFAQGYVRDLRVRWALEEAGIPYEPVLIDPDIQASADYRAWQPFGQVPAYRDGAVEIFESGAIVLHIAEQSEALSPKDPAGRAQVTTWVIAALNSVEPHVAAVSEIDLFHKGEAWTEERRPQVIAYLKTRLDAVAKALGSQDYILGRFTAADIILSTVLREADRKGLASTHPNLHAYIDRCEARPAFQKAMADQLEPFAKYAPAA